MAPARFHPDDLLRTVKNTYRSIDLRVAAIRDGDIWKNVLTVLRFSHLSARDARAQLKDELNGRGRVETEHFRIETAVVPFKALDRIRAAAADGNFHVGRLVARLSEPLDWHALAPSYLCGRASAVKPRGEVAWPGVEVIRDRTPPSHLVHDETVCREVASIGYETPYQAIAAFCGADVWPNSSHGGDIYLWLPVYASFGDLSIVPTSSQMTVPARIHRSLRNVRAIVVRRPQNSGGVETRWDLSLPLHKGDGGTIRSVKATAPIGLCDGTTAFDVLLVHSALGEIQRRFVSATELLPRPQVNALLEALKRFCSESALEDLLLRPATVASKPSKPSVAFEHHVAWLLSLCGCSAIVLGEYETSVDT